MGRTINNLDYCEYMNLFSLFTAPVLDCIVKISLNAWFWLDTDRKSEEELVKSPCEERVEIFTPLSGYKVLPFYWIREKTLLLTVLLRPGVWELLGHGLSHWLSTWGKGPVSSGSTGEGNSVVGPEGVEPGCISQTSFQGWLPLGKDLFLEIPQWSSPLRTWNLLIWVSDLLPFLYCTFLSCWSFCPYTSGETSFPIILICPIATPGKLKTES